MSRRAPGRSGAGAPPRRVGCRGPATGDGLEAAVAGADAVIHAATDPRGDAKRTDVGGTELLLEAARARGCGMSSTCRSSASIASRTRTIESSSRRGPHSLGAGAVRLCADAFHDFMDSQFRRLTRYPIGLLPKSWLGQPVHVDEFADALWDCVAAGPGRRAPDVAGPEVLRYGEMMRAWLAAQGRRKLVLDLPLRGRMAAAFRGGGATAPGRAVGRMTWGEWVQMRYAGAASS